MPKKHTLVPFYCRLREDTRAKLASYAYQNRHSQASIVEIALRAYFSDRAPLSDRINQLKVPT